MGNIIKYCIIIIHIILGLILIFLNVNNLLHLANLATQSPDKQYYYGISLSQGFAEAILGVILGLFSIVGAVAFRKDKRWAIIRLPIIPLVLSAWMFYVSIRYPLEGLAAVGTAFYIIAAIILLVFFISEILYITLRKQKQSD